MSPLVSVIMPARNVERFVDQAVESVCRQTLDSLELIVIDDGSTDATPARVRSHAASDARITVLSGEGRGPGAARNLGLARAKGRWVSVVDADDAILADRLERLVRVVGTAQLAADNLTAFYDDGRPDRVWLQGGRWDADHDITLDAFLRSGIGGGATDQPGYLKPMFDREWMQSKGLLYDEGLSIGEDYDLVARALAAGGVYRYLAEPGYRYRRHGGSISHRIRADQLEAMIDAFGRLRPEIGEAEQRALDRRVAMLVHDRQFVEVVEKLKIFSPRAALRAVSNTPLRRRLMRAVRDGLGRRLRRR